MAFKRQATVAEQRQEIQRLMDDSLRTLGNNRNSLGSNFIDLHSPRVCKAFLVGECIYDVFSGTKADMGKCPKQHYESHKMEYERQVALGKTFPEFYFDYELQLEQFLKAEDGRAREGTERDRKFERSEDDVAEINSRVDELAKLQRKLDLVKLEVEALGRQGQIQTALEQVKRLEDAQSDYDLKEFQLNRAAELSGFMSKHKLQKCDACGAYLSRLDDDDRLANHFYGKLHRGWRKVRNNYQAVKKANLELTKKMEKRLDLVY